MATIQGVYVALFGRPADPTGLAYFNSVTKNGADLSGIGDLASTQEYKDRFAGQNNTQIVNSIYQSLFGRDAEAAGLTFFVNALNTGSLNIKNIAIAILDGAQGTDKTIVTNKVAAADLYTSHLDTAQEIGSYQGNTAAAQGRAFIATVTTTVPTAAAVDAAILTMQAAGAAGNTITATGAFTDLNLTTGVGAVGDVKTTTNNNDTINASTFFADTNKIDAGLGVDTVNGTIGAATVTLLDTTLKNVEIVNITSTDDTAVLAATNKAVGLQQLWSVANTGGGSSFTANAVDLSTTVGVKGDFTGKTNTFNFDSVDSGSTAKLALDTAKGTVAIATAGTVEVSNSNTSNVALTLDAKTVNVSGAGALTVSIADANLESVKASSFTGNLTYDSTANKATIKSIVGGSGSDTLTIAADHAKDATVDAGAGADIIKVGAATAAAKLGLTGGADADQFVFAAGIKNGGAATDTDLAKTMITINDFGTGTDVIKVSTGAASNFSHAVVPAEQAAIAAKATLTEALTEVASYVGANQQGAVFAWHGDSYIFVNDGVAGYDANDTVIKVAGVSDIATFTASTLVFSA